MKHCQENKKTSESLGKIFTKYIANKGHPSKIYKELITLNNTPLPRSEQTFHQR
jgi:hypothetical protein